VETGKRVWFEYGTRGLRTRSDPEERELMRLGNAMHRRSVINDVK
jgi:hypothetical protein